MLTGGIVSWIITEYRPPFTHCLNRKFCNSDLIDFSTLWVRIFNVTACLLPFLFSFIFSCFFLLYFISFSFLLCFFFSFVFILFAGELCAWLYHINCALFMPRARCIQHAEHHSVCSMCLEKCVFVSNSFFSPSSFIWIFIIFCVQCFQTIVEFLVVLALSVKRNIRQRSTAISISLQSFIYEYESKPEWNLKRKGFFFIKMRELSADIMYWTHGTLINET